MVYRNKFMPWLQDHRFFSAHFRYGKRTMPGHDVAFYPDRS